jgi:hypothetical protein
VSALQDSIREYYELRPTEYSVVRTMTISQGIGPTGICEQTLSLVLQKELGSPGKSLFIEFHGVRNLLLRQPEWSLISMGHIEISAPSELQKYSSTLLVRDSDQEQIIRFECRDFEAHVG